ncbi:hypothetical protein ACMGDM_16850 [Sphingomonas sp. DT-51]
MLRIGMSGEPIQAHHFECRNCGQEMGITLEDKVGMTFGPNATRATHDDSGPVVNLHPSFVFTKEDIGRADAFPSVELGSKLVGAMLEARARVGLPGELPPRPELPERARVTEEWPPLRAAWSLSRNGKAELAQKRIDSFVSTAGYEDTPTSIQDWLFQFIGDLTRPYFERLWEGLFEQLRVAVQKADFRRFVAFYDTELSTAHSRRYFEICKAYLGAFSEFSQVHQLVASDIPVDNGHVAASSNFDLTRMFYGNAFEAFGDNVEILTAINNLIEDRPFDQLASITFEKYRSTDKAGRTRAFGDNPALSAVAAEFDNRLRNASHHGGMTFDRASGLIEYRAGKGAQADAENISYAAYLARSSRLFIQLMLVFRLEILIANKFGARLPI